MAGVAACNGGRVVITWRYDKGIWRGQSDKGTFYRVEWKGGRWRACINRAMTFPYDLKMHDTAAEAMTVCAEHDRNPAGTVDRESDMRVEVRG